MARTFSRSVARHVSRAHDRPHSAPRMTRTARPRHQFALALAAALPLLLAACSDSQYPNSTFTNLTDINRDAGSLWNLMIWLGIAVFVFVELLLVYVMIKYRRRSE